MPITCPQALVILLLFCSACGQNDSSENKELGSREAGKVIENSSTDSLGVKSSFAQADSTDKQEAFIKTTKEKNAVNALLDYDTSRWTELIRLDSSFVLDLKYATEDNFVKEQLYDCPRCFLRPEAAHALQQAQEEFKRTGLRIKLLDCYRPSPIQQRLWDKVPNASYVTPPSKGSMHNRGLAVDLTLVDADGKELDMGTPYDFFGREAHHTCTDLPEEVLDNRRLLKSTMEKFGFKSIRTEWWHYSFPKSSFGFDDMEWACGD
jgi:zinc D-Ala-D-Ala dipeptidase